MGKQVEFGATVPEEEHSRFKQTLPMYGGVKFFINETLRHFNDEMEKDPVVREKMRLAVQRTIDGMGLPA